MAPLRRSYTTSYWPVIRPISIALSCIIFELFDVEKCRVLEILVMGHSPCEFMHDLYIAEIYRPGVIFLRLMDLSSFTTTYIAISGKSYV